MGFQGDWRDWLRVILLMFVAFGKCGVAWCNGHFVGTRRSLCIVAQITLTLRCMLTQAFKKGTSGPLRDVASSGCADALVWQEALTSSMLFGLLLLLVREVGMNCSASGR